MKIYALVPTAALAVFACLACSISCSKEGDKVIFHGDEAKEKTGEAAKKVGEGAEKAAEKTEELGKKALEGAKEIGRETEEEIKEEAPRETPPTATGGGPAHDAGE